MVDRPVVLDSLGLKIINSGYWRRLRDRVVRRVLGVMLRLMVVRRRRLVSRRLRLGRPLGWHTVVAAGRLVVAASKIVHRC